MSRDTAATLLYLAFRSYVLTATRLYLEVLQVRPHCHVIIPRSSVGTPLLPRDYT